MALLSDVIEQFIKDLFEEESAIELQRNELAAYFGCAPSQINYVLTTRFSLDRGYVISSRRGGGGSIQIARLSAQGESYLHELLNGRLSGELTQKEAEAILGRLLEDEWITQREYELMHSATGRLPMVPRNVEGYVRAEILKTMILALLRSEEHAV